MKSLKTGISTLVIAFALASCGSSGGGSSNTDANNPYGVCGNNANSTACYNSQFSNIYGPNPNGYYTGTQSCGGYTCQVYTVPAYTNGCNGGCGTQTYLVAPQGAYLPDYGISDGGGFYVGIGISISG